MSAKAERCAYLNKEGWCIVSHLGPSKATRPEIKGVFHHPLEPGTSVIVVKANCTVPYDPEQQKTCSHYSKPTNPKNFPAN